MHSVYYTDGFASPIENMHFDSELVDGLGESERRIRLYEWGERGLTYGYKQDLPQDLLQVPNSQRPSGGGIVFHSPGDWVLSVSAHLNDALFPKGLRGALEFISSHITHCFSEMGIDLSLAGDSDRESNILFCNQYPNPYELQYEGEKAVALTLRRYRDRFLIQGIIHCQSNRKSYSDFADYGPALTRGLNGILDARDLEMQMPEDTASGRAAEPRAFHTFSRLFFAGFSG